MVVVVVAEVVAAGEEGKVVVSLGVVKICFFRSSKFVFVVCSILIVARSVLTDNSLSSLSSVVNSLSLKFSVMRSRRVCASVVVSANSVASAKGLENSSSPAFPGNVSSGPGLTGKGESVLLDAIVEGSIVLVLVGEGGGGLDVPSRMEGFLFGSCVVIVFKENLLFGACIVAVELAMLLLEMDDIVVLLVPPSARVPVVEGLVLVFSNKDWRGKKPSETTTEGVFTFTRGFEVEEGGGGEFDGLTGSDSKMQQLPT